MPQFLSLSHAFDPQIIALVQLLEPDLDAQLLPARISAMRSQGAEFIGVFEDSLLGIAAISMRTHCFSGRTAYVENVVFDPAARQRGLGERLMDWLEQYAKSNHKLELLATLLQDARESGLKPTEAKLAEKIPEEKSRDTNKQMERSEAKDETLEAADPEEHKTAAESDLLSPMCKKKCSFIPCKSAPSTSKFQVVVSLVCTKFKFCSLQHFWSEAQKESIFKCIDRACANIRDGDTSPAATSTIHSCTRSRCGKKCDNLISLGTLSDDDLVMFFCSVRCLVDHLHLVKKGTWEKAARKREQKD